MLRAGDVCSLTGVGWVPNDVGSAGNAAFGSVDWIERDAIILWDLLTTGSFEDRHV